MEKTVYGYWKYQYSPTAAEECEALLKHMGISNAKVYGSRGSHSAEVYIFNKESEEKFKKEVLPYYIKGERLRDFYFGLMQNRNCYSVSYIGK